MLIFIITIKFLALFSVCCQFIEDYRLLQRILLQISDWPDSILSSDMYILICQWKRARDLIIRLCENKRSVDTSFLARFLEHQLFYFCFAAKIVHYRNKAYWSWSSKLLFNDANSGSWWKNRPSPQVLKGLDGLKKYKLFLWNFLNLSKFCTDNRKRIDYLCKNC